MASKGRAPANVGDILWNFEKFLLGKDGVLSSASPDMTPTIRCWWPRLKGR